LVVCWLSALIDHRRASRYIANDLRVVQVCGYDFNPFRRLGHLTRTVDHADGLPALDELFRCGAPDGASS
jgi:hypothetical protein